MSEINPGVSTPDIDLSGSYTFGGIDIPDTMADLLKQQVKLAEQQIATQSASGIIRVNKDMGLAVARNF